MDPAAAELRGCANRVTAQRNRAENTARSAQHALAEELLRAVPAARQRELAVDCWEHVEVFGAIRD
jgi:hypothetical protein